MAGSMDLTITAEDGRVSGPMHVEVSGRELPPHVAAHLADVRAMRDSLQQIVARLDEQDAQLRAAPPAFHAGLSKAMGETWSRLEKAIEPIVARAAQHEQNRALRETRTQVEAQVRHQVLTAGALFGAATAEFRWTGERNVELIVKNRMGVQLNPHYYGCGNGSFTVTL